MMDYKLSIISGVCLGIIAALSSCAGDDTVQYRATAPPVCIESLDDILDDTGEPDARYACRLDSAPGGGIRLTGIRPRSTLGRMFNDSNHVHLAEAEALGITPITDMRSAWRLRRPIVRMQSCADFYIDSLSHSYPYLVPEAAVLLHEIGRRFRAALDARGGGAYRIKVTSLLRTPATVSRLRRVNGNAVSSSAHRFATTFDISHTDFACDNDSLPRTFEDLKNLLAMVVDSLRAEGRCYVKNERKQSCLHITVRSTATRPPAAPNISHSNL